MHLRPKPPLAAGKTAREWGGHGDPLEQTRISGAASCEAGCKFGFSVDCNRRNMGVNEARKPVRLRPLPLAVQYLQL
jgi:hypothetical protein